MRRVVLALFIVACGSSTAAPRQTVFGGDRQVVLQVPAKLDPAKHYPLILVLHGYGATGRVQEGFFGVNALVDGSEAFVLAPDGNANSMGLQYWNADPACCDFEHANPDDVGYLGGLIDDVTAAWSPIDKGMVILLGHSNGGYMAYRMACDRADVVTNILVLAGAAASDPQTCNPSQPVEVLHMHGTADTEVPYDQNAVQSVTQWAAHDGCGTTRTPGPAMDLDTVQPGAETQTATADGCPAGISVDLWTIQGAGHIPNLAPTFAQTALDYALAHRRPL